MARIRPFGADDVRPCKGMKKRKGRRTGPFLEFFLLPVGLADFMETDAKAYLATRQQEIVTEMSLRWTKKPRLFKGAASLTGRKSHQPHEAAQLVGTTMAQSG